MMDEMFRQKQKRPSVLRQVLRTASTEQHGRCGGTVSALKEETDGGRHADLLHLHMREDVSTETRLQDGTAEKTSSLFGGGLCRWPGCGAITEDFTDFLKHLHSEHRNDERGVAQWAGQQDRVQLMERQLLAEKQKLRAMQLHLLEQKRSDAWPSSLPLLLPASQLADDGGIQIWGVKHLEELAHHGYASTGPTNLLPDLVPSMECYRYTNIRPPYTYAYLIRWSILASPDKQRSLNDIYNWFTTMFFYFRHNTATWKNAVRHNLSLHKCFVRVEGGKGAVWTVDEREYQRRKGQKYHRDCPMKWMTSFARFYPEDQ